MIMADYQVWMEDEKVLVSKSEKEEVDGRSFLLNPDRQSVSNAGVSCTWIIPF